jgi:hypothetical protein
LTSLPPFSSDSLLKNSRDWKTKKIMYWTKMPNPHCIGIKNKIRSKPKFLKRFLMSSKKKKVVVCQPLPSFFFLATK